MHKQFRELLEKAKGTSEHIIAVVIDIRGFTSFCQTVDSLGTAVFIKRIYMKIIDDYFSNASFYKPTGDGLLIIVPYDDATLKENLKKTVQSCLKLVESFPRLCEGDNMINFPTPDKIGIGIARGSACRIESDGKTLDYSGRVINLASRLMETSRPSGVSFDESLGCHLLDEIKEHFVKDVVYIRSVAEEKPLTVYYTKNYTLIPDTYKRPLKEPRWVTDSVAITFGRFKSLTPSSSVYLEHIPLDKSKIICEIHHPRVEDGKVDTKYMHIIDMGIDGVSTVYLERGDERFVKFNVQPTILILEPYHLTDETPLLFVVRYPVA